VALTTLSFLHVQFNKRKQRSRRRRRRRRRHHHHHHRFILKLISVYLRASLTEQRPIIKPAQIHKYTETEKKT
jgi:hypothetical protein